MRSRPKVTTYLRPAIVTPGTPLDVEVVLTSESETPIDFVELALVGHESVQFGRYGASRRFLGLHARHGERTLGVGEHRLAAHFDLPASLPPSYRGTAANIAYALDVHVSIPWWPDRTPAVHDPRGAGAGAFRSDPADDPEHARRPHGNGAVHRGRAGLHDPRRSAASSPAPSRSSTRATRRSGAWTSTWSAPSAPPGATATSRPGVCAGACSTGRPRRARPSRFACRSGAASGSASRPRCSS